MRKLIPIFLFLLVSCSPKMMPTPGEKTITKILDSVVYHVKDSIVVVPREKIVNITLPNQTSDLETTLAQSKAYTDSLGFLHHQLENKNNTTLKTKVVYEYKELRDTTYIEKPVPYEVVKTVKKTPGWARFTLIYLIITALLFVARFLIKR